ncbi:cytochrome bc complex cytochrome b subunit [Streptomyces sp. YIM 98790]|uniref:cytochrome bc1 complex cytochrome b subunit n=1 Tax=Streptomyces sp. YIM 98790 TaxID=2689077 RepID=UPI00140B0562|nr:cytochrome bc complex cytochrome b subunit [Streptomyces sp. YIM 98790]
MSTATDETTTARRGRAPAGERLADWADGRLGVYGAAKYGMRKVFPDHWSFLLGEIALFSFIIVLLTGVYLTLFFVPSMAEVEYHGSYVPMQGQLMSEAYASTLDISFDVRGGLLVRQIHHWGALVFVVAIFIHMMRVFFTGAFRKPREINWLFGFTLFILALFTGLTGYSLPDDLLSGTGIRFMEGAILATPVVGTWIQMLLFGGEFPGHDIIPRFFVIHVLLLPGLLLALVVAHLILIVFHKHTHYANPGRTNKNVVGMPFFPVYMAKAGGFSFITFGVLTLMAGTVTINPVWTIGPYRPETVSTNAQPDWYLGFSEGLVRMMPGWEMELFGEYTLNLGLLVPLGVFPAMLIVLMLYPFFENWVTKDTREHHIAQRPRNVPTRTAFGMAWLSAYFVALVAGGNDVWAINFDLSINAITWFCRIGFFVLPVVVFFLTRRICLGLQRRDREKVLHGRETGIIKRLPHGEFIEVHEPLPPEQLYKLTAHDQPKPLALPPAVDENGVERKVGRMEKLRVRLSRSYFGEHAQIPKATAEEYREITSGHGHH